MRYCNRCTYPINARPTIIFDQEGICSGCRNHEKFKNNVKVDWKDRKKKLDKIKISKKKTRQQIYSQKMNSSLKRRGGGFAL